MSCGELLLSAATKFLAELIKLLLFYRLGLIPTMVLHLGENLRLDIVLFF